MAMDMAMAMEAMDWDMAMAAMVATSMERGVPTLSHTSATLSTVAMPLSLPLPLSVSMAMLVPAGTWLCLAPPCMWLRGRPSPTMAMEDSMVDMEDTMVDMDTAVDTSMARGALMLMLRLIPTTTEDMAMVVTAMAMEATAVVTSGVK